MGAKIVIVLLSASLLPTARAQFVQQGPKLVGTGVAGYAEQGYSVALSGDGNTAIVGGPNDNGGVGAVWVYTRSGGVWAQEGTKLVPPAGVGTVGFGTSVTLSSDGNTAIVGAPGAGGGAGAAWVFTQSAGVWSEPGTLLIGTGAVGGAAQGNAVALSGDGNTAILGGMNDNDQMGAAWVFTQSGGVWTQQGPKLIGTGVANSFAPDAQGSSVALSADGNTAIVGGIFDNFEVGAAWVYTRTGGVWSQQGAKLVGTGATSNSHQGASVALSADGNTALVGGSSDNLGIGATWVYTRAGGVWSQQGSKLVGSGFVGYVVEQGLSVALSADGNTALVGGNGDNDIRGAAWAFTRSGGVWSQAGNKLVGVGADAGVLEGAAQGSSVALSGDGSTAIVGGPADNSTSLPTGQDIGVGAAWVFVLATGPTISSTSAGVVNGASFLPGIAPGTWITIMGAYLSQTTRSWTAADFSGNNLPTQLDGVSVTINGKPAYVAYISPQQLNVLTPDDVAQGPVPIQVLTPQGATNVVNATESALAPAPFTFTQDGIGYAAAVRADGAYIGPPNLIPGVTTVFANPGDTIMLFGTGFGPTTPPSAIGQLVSPAPLANPVTVTIGGLAATVEFAGIVGPGLYQFNVVVPNVGGIPTVVVEIGGGSTQAVILPVQ